MNVFGTEILLKSQKNGPKNAEIFGRWNTEDIKNSDTRCKKVGLWSGLGACKEGASKRHIPVYI